MLARASNAFSAPTRKHSCHREQVLRAELQAIADQANDQAALLRLAETLTAFLARLHGAADTLSIRERQRIVRLVVKDVLIGDDAITIRHSIPVLPGPPQGSLPPSQTAGPNYLLCKGSDDQNAPPGRFGAANHIVTGPRRQWPFLPQNSAGQPDTAIHRHFRPAHSRKL